MGILVTVVVMIYNNIDYLQSSIASIYQQDYSDIELIVSDDGSEKITLENIESIVQSVSHEDNIHDIVVRKNEHNMGIVAHYNKLIEMASGEIMILLSGGDRFYSSSVISAIVRCFEEHNCLLVTGKRMCYDVKTGQAIELLPNEIQSEIIEEGGQRLIDSLCRGNYISGACTYYSKDLFQKYGKFDERMYLIEDLPIYLKALFNGEKIYMMDETAIWYAMDGVSNGSVENPIFLKDKKKIYEEIILKNQDKIGKDVIRYLKCKNYYNDHRNLLGILHSLLYPDVIIDKMMRSTKRRRKRV